MTHEQSLKNIEILKNFIIPFCCDYIYFDFKNPTDFKAIFLDEKESSKFDSFLKIQSRSKLPYSFIRMESNGEEILYYSDKMIRYEYSLTTHEVIKDEYKIFKESCPGQLKLDMARLVFKLKNI